MARHKLAVIVFTDIVGYSAMMSQDEDSALSMLKINKEIHETWVREYEGQYLKEIGDGTLCSFETASEAVSASLALQKSAISKDIPLRIGIHLGEVAMEGNEIYGDGVNIAARLEKVGCAGSILMTKKVRDEIENKGFNTVSLGAHEFKNISRPIHVYALDAEGLCIPDISTIPQTEGNAAQEQRKTLRLPAWMIFIFAFIVLASTAWFFSKQRTSIENHNVTGMVSRVAVFPFSHRGPKDQDYLGEGLMDVINSRISGISGFASIDPNVTHKLHIDHQGNLESIKRSKLFNELGVDYILTGSIINTVNGYIISGNLQSKTGELLNKIEFKTSSADSVFLYSNQIVLNLFSLIYDKSNQSFTGKGILTSNDYNALNEFLKGEQERRKGNVEKANNLYLKAIEIDSTFAMAWFRYSQNLGNLSYVDSNMVIAWNQVESLIEEFPPQIQNYIKALGYADDGNPTAALKILNASLNYHGTNVDVLYSIGDIIWHCFLILDRPHTDAVPYFEKAVANSNPSWEAFGHLTWAYTNSNQFEKYDSLLTQFEPIYSKSELWDEVKRIHELEFAIQEHGINSVNPDSIIHSPYGTYLTFMETHKLDSFDIFLEANKHRFRDTLHFQRLKTRSLLLQGKIEEANSYRQDLVLGNSRMSRVLNDQFYQPFKKAVLDSGYSAVQKFTNSNPSPFLFGSLGVYEVFRESSTLESRKKLYELREQNKHDLDSGKIDIRDYQRNERSINYNVQRVNIAKASIDSDAILLESAFDSIFNNIMHFDNYGITTLHYIGPKYHQAEFEFKKGNYEKSMMICQNLLDTEFFAFHAQIIAPVYFRLATSEDKLGMNSRALEHYKYFYSLYKNSDPFYQDNVQFAKKRIEELEAMQIEMN